ncbi:MAG: 2OG-Fe(II) oxygenase [Sphingomonadales bacterium]|nr:2OG-Fe(II) oxygenase [Sphingomonadales bacterium]
MTAPGESSASHLLSIPGMQRIDSPGSELFLLRQFLSPPECEALIQRIEARRRPSTIADANGDEAFRTSETCDFDPADPLVNALAAKLAWLSGIDPAHGEPMQGQRYAVGQQFKPHTDYFEPHGADFPVFCAVSGQRTWTFMVYLDDVPAGGETCFEALGKTIRPQRGKLVCWNNRLPDGQVNPRTIHHAMKVRRGVKHVVTRWYRERPWG